VLELSFGRVCRKKVGQDMPEEEETLNAAVRDTVISEETVPASKEHAGDSDLLLQSHAIIDEKYEVLSLLGKGGMCTVYKAKHLTLDRLVALKVLQRTLVRDEDALPRFKREAIAISGLDHPNIVKVFGFGVHGNAPFMAIEYLEGISLAELLKQEHRLSKERALPIFVQILDALSHAHERGVIHRDLKPSNVMLIGSDQVKLVDFGIAKILPEPGKELQKLTRTGEVFGTAVYMSPEQCRAEALDARSDLYSMGCLMYEVLDGQVPIKGDTYYATLSRQLTDDPRESTFLSHDFGRSILYALKKETKDRPQSASELKEALLNPSSLVAKTTKETAQKKPLKQWVMRGCIALIVVQLIAGVLFVCFQPRQSMSARLNQLDMEIDAIPAGDPKQIEKILTQLSNLVSSIRGPQERDQLLFSIQHLLKRVNQLEPSVWRFKLQMRVIQAYLDLKKPLESQSLNTQTILSLQQFISGEVRKSQETIRYEQLQEACKFYIWLCRNDSSKIDMMLAQLNVVETLLLHAGRFSEAEWIAKSALESVLKQGKASSLSVLNATANLGSIQRDAGKLAKAEKNLRNAFELCEKQYPSNAQLVRGFGEKLIDCYRAENKMKDAENVRAIINVK
jgi:serine/threonine protein kinase